MSGSRKGVQGRYVEYGGLGVGFGEWSLSGLRAPGLEGLGALAAWGLLVHYKSKRVALRSRKTEEELQQSFVPAS